MSVNGNGRLLNLVVKPECCNTEDKCWKLRGYLVSVNGRTWDLVV